MPHALDALEIGGVGQRRSVEQEAEVVGDDLRCIERAEGIDEGVPVGECRGNVLPDVLGEARTQREHSRGGCQPERRGRERHGGEELHRGGKAVGERAEPAALICDPYWSLRPICTTSL